MKDHAPLFAMLTLALVAGFVLVAVVVGDPARGLLLGILPTAFVFVVWALTNRAGYPDRAPETLPHQRVPLEGEEDGAVSAWDPFEGERMVVREANPERAPQGDGPFIPPPSQPKRPPDTPTVGSSASAISEPTTTEGPRSETAPKPPNKKQTATATSKTAPKPPNKKQTATAKKETAPKPPARQTQAGTSDSPSSPSKPNSTPSNPERSAAPDTPDEVSERLTPAEAAKRDAANRKRSKKRKGTPDAAA
ncbi:MAG: hypothetical protein HKM97_12960 [Acidimicrobiia bacterium]|nr:hypothetical protein [Acidimicrobiia bacterium]NNJ47645.1 hypothetical protein [Acidimicrobiia bacterium]